MKGLILGVLFIALGEGNWFFDKLAVVATEAAGFDISDTCGFTRDDALQCIKKFVDANHDGQISCEEFERAKLLYMPPRARAALWVAKKLGMDVHFDQLLYGTWLVVSHFHH